MSGTGVQLGLLPVGCPCARENSSARHIEAVPLYSSQLGGRRSLSVPHSCVQPCNRLLVALQAHLFASGVQIGGASKRRLPSDYSWADQWVACNASLHSQVCPEAWSGLCCAVLSCAVLCCVSFMVGIL